MPQMSLPVPQPEAAEESLPVSRTQPSQLALSRIAPDDPFADEFEFIDDIHGPIHLNRLERDVVDTPEFQRLFRLGQLGFVDLVYPTANHTRGTHSIGACFWAKKLVKTLNDNNAKSTVRTVPIISRAERVLISLGVLAHDLPHGPFSHDIEKKTHYIYPCGTHVPKRVISHYGPYEKHDNFLLNPALFVFLLDAKHSVLARVLRHYSRSWVALLLSDAHLHAHLAEFGERIQTEWLERDEEILPSLLFHLLVYEKLDEARKYSVPLLTRFDSAEASDWGIGAPSAWKVLHETWYQPFRHDIIGDTLSADLLDYLLRDQSRLGMKNELDLKLLNYYVLVRFPIPDENKTNNSTSSILGADARAANLHDHPRYRCAIDLYDHKRGTFRAERLNDIFRLLDFRHQIHEKAVYHRVVQSAIAMLSRTGLILREKMPSVPELYGFGNGTGALAGDERFLEYLVKASEEPINGAEHIKSGTPLHQSIPCKLAERRVYRPLMVIPGDRVATLLKGHYNANEEPQHILRELAAIVDSTFFARFFLPLAALIEALLKHAIESEDKLDTFIQEMLANPAHLARVWTVVPKGVIFWTTPYKQLYKDPAILVCTNDDEIMTIEDLQGERSMSEPLRKRVQAGIADAEAKNEGIWKLYVFLSDGLFYTGACARVIPNHPCNAASENHEAHLHMAQNIVIRGLRCAWEYWQAREKVIDLNATMRMEELVLLFKKFVGDSAMFKLQQDNIRPVVSAVNVTQYLHGDHSPKCRDVRYKFDMEISLEEVLERIVSDSNARELVREAIRIFGIYKDDKNRACGEELSEIVAQFARHSSWLPSLIETVDRGAPIDEALIRTFWLGELEPGVPTSIQQSTQSIADDVVVPSIRLNRLEVFSGLCRIVLRKDYTKHEQSILSLYEAKINELSDEQFDAKMEEFKRSVAGTPGGKGVRERRAVGEEDTTLYKLKLFLDGLLETEATKFLEK